MSPAINLHRSLPLGWSTLLSRLPAPVDIAFLVYFLIAFGAVVLWQYIHVALLAMFAEEV